MSDRPYTLADMRVHLERLDDDLRPVIPIKTMNGSVGGKPFVEVKSALAGWDWDKGKLLIYPNQPVHIVGDTYEAEKKASRDKGEALAFIWMTTSSKQLDHSQKLRAIRQTLRRFGFNHGLDDD